MNVGEVRRKGEVRREEEVFGIIRENRIGWTESGVRVLNRWMEMAERWNRGELRGSGGFAIEQYVNNSFICLASAGHEGTARDLRTKDATNSDTED